MRTALLLLLSLAARAAADTYHIAPSGRDSTDRDGRSPNRAWASLAYACDQVPAGDHTIRLAPGAYEATRTAFPKAGITIDGPSRKKTDEHSAILRPGPDWTRAETPRQADPKSHYLIALDKVDGVSIRFLQLVCTPSTRIAGGIYATGSNDLELLGLNLREFRWTGIRVEHARGLDLKYCHFFNASTDKDGWHGGAITTRWIKDSEIHHNLILSRFGGGYGYKAGGHENVRFHHNQIDVNGGFSFESAHENEYGIEVDRNYFTGCISIPKGGQAADPNERGHEYSFWIHDNLLTDSYTVEGPRNHLRLSHNYIVIRKPNGRVYTHHGGTNHGPIWIHHNVIENVDRALVWMHRGLAENIHVYNNTVHCAPAGKRKGSLFGAHAAERLNGWVVRNNVFIAPPEEPRKLMDDARGVPGKILADHNLCVNIIGAPDGNVTTDTAGFANDGDRPWPSYVPTPGGNLVDRGVDVGLPFAGNAPDLGAYEADGDKPSPGPIWHPPQSRNPIVKGWYADPEVVVYDDTVWIYPTTSARYPDQLYFDCFSSTDLVHWTQHERILDNQAIPWARQAMWAPSSIRKDGKYYFFFGANDIQSNGELGGIGVAVADRPEGPYRDVLGKPLIDKILHGAQPIDQFVFKEGDDHFLVYGGWGQCNIARLNDDFTGFLPFPDGETFKSITPENYREGPVMFRRKGKLYFMWSEGGWTGPDYSVAYAIADSPLGPFERVGKVLQQDPQIATGAGHHSVLNLPGTDEWYIVYHRRPLGETDRDHRVTCIDRMTFDDQGRILPVTITFHGVYRRRLNTEH